MPAELSGRFIRAAWFTICCSAPTTTSTNSISAESFPADAREPVWHQRVQPGVWTGPDAIAVHQPSSRSEGFYLQDQIDLTEHWKMLAGVRFDDFTQDILNRMTGTTQSQSQTATSPRFGLVYDGSDRVVIRELPEGSASTPVWAQRQCLEPETARPTKSAPSLAVRRIRHRHARGLQGGKVKVLTSDPINAGFSAAAGEAESKGVEVDVAGDRG